MPVFEITDGAGRTLELEGDHEPTAQELEGIFRESFPQEKIQPMTQEAADKVASSKRTVRGEFEKQGQQFNEALFKPFAGVKKLVDEAIPSFVPETPKMQQLIGMSGLGQAQQTAAGVSERVKDAVESVASPGGIMLAGTAPAAPAIVGPVVAATVAPQAIEGVKELGRGEIALGLTDLALTAPVIAGGAVSGARGLSNAARSRTATSRIPESPVDPASTLQGATKTFEDTIVKPATEGAPNASEFSEATALHGDVLRNGEIGTPKEGLPVNEGQPGVRSQEETVTLYRAVSPTENFNTVFNADQLNQFAHPEQPGEFWTSDPKYADYFKESYGKDATIETRTIPAEEAKKYRVSPNEFKIPKGASDLTSKPAAEGGAALAASTIETPAGKVEPAGGSLGVTPNPLLAKLVDAAVPRQQGTPPPLQLDTSTNFPDYSPINVANKNFARAFGVGRVPVLGWLFDPNARIRLPFQESLGRYFSERFDVARAQASAVGEMIRGRIDKAFTIDQAGRLKGVEGPEGKDPFWVDAFEAEEARPGSYNFTPEQRAALQVWLDLKKEAEPLMEKYKLTREMDDESMSFDDMLALEPQKGEGKKGYAPRIVRERPAQTARVGTGGVGSKASFEKPRLFPTMREGFEKGVRYEPSPEASIATWSERLYKRIADKRLAEDPNLGAVPVAEKRAELREYYADKVASGEWTPERLDQTVESVISQGRVDQPAFAGKFLEPEIAAAVSKAFPKGQHFMWRELANTTSFLKGLKFGFDWGAPMIQGLPTFLKAFTSPRDAKAWANGVAGMIKAQFSAEALPIYVKNNIEPIRELAAYGSSVGRLNEMVSGIGEGAPTTKAIEAAGRRLTDAGKPIVGKPVEWAAQGMEAFARSFGAFIDITKVELWKAFREITPKEQWGDVIRGIETQLLTSRMEGLGISRGQALVERVALIAASYVRGSVNLIGGALIQPGVSGSMMRKAMGSMMITAPVLFYGIGRAIGMRDDELKERLNPASSEFMMWRIPVGERNVNVGLGGIFKSYARLAGNIVKQAEENPKMMHMPFARWYQGHAGPLVSTGWEGFTGRDFMGNEITLPEIIGKSVLPMTAETVLSTKSKEGGASLADAAFGLAGLNAFPQSLGRQFMEERETMARTQFKKPYEKLPVGDQFRINVELRRKALFEERTEQTLPQKEAQARKELMRQKVINKQLPQEVQDRLEVLGVVLPAYEPSLRIGNQTMTFTKAQESAYQNFIVDEYTKNLPEILKNPKLDTATPKQRQEVIGMLAAKMRESAKLRLLQAINLEADK